MAAVEVVVQEYMLRLRHPWVLRKQLLICNATAPVEHGWSAISMSSLEVLP